MLTSARLRLIEASSSFPWSSLGMMVLIWISEVVFSKGLVKSCLLSGRVGIVSTSLSMLRDIVGGGHKNKSRFRQTLNANKYTSKHAMYATAGRYPLAINRKLRMNYWLKLNNKKYQTYSKKV